MTKGSLNALFFVLIPKNRGAEDLKDLGLLAW